LARRFQRAKLAKLQPKTEDGKPVEVKEVKETDKQKLVTAGAIFGDLTLITHKRWKPANVYALEESSILKFPNQQINRIIKVLSIKQ